MVNRARGEVPFDWAGRRFRLCLTLGALAEIEAGLGAESLEALEARLARPRVRDLAVILAALLRGGGAEIEEGALLAEPLDIPAASRAIAATFRAAGLASTPAAARPEAAPPGEAGAPPEGPAATGGASS